VRFTSLCAPVDEVDTPSRLLTGGLRTGETTVTRGDPAEAALTPLQFASTSLLDAFYGVLGVLASSGAVSLHRAWHLDHGFTSASCDTAATDDPFMNSIEPPAQQEGEVSGAYYANTM
jgi:hypothetical protein